MDLLYTMLLPVTAAVGVIQNGQMAFGAGADGL
jgi:hypothetical protein